MPDLSRDLSQDERPEPFSTPDCDLRGLEWMPLDAANLLDSDLFLESTGDEFKAAIALICASWRQVPAGSLPRNEGSLAMLARTQHWTEVRTMALRNWVLCSDGRLYHPIVAAKAMEALPLRQEYVHKKSSEAERKERERKERKDMFARLREAGIVMKWDTKTGDLRAAIARLDQSRDLSHPKRDTREPPSDSFDPQTGGQADSTHSLHESPPPGDPLPPSEGLSQDQSRDQSRDLSRLRQGQGQGPLIQNPSGSVGAPAAPSPPAPPPAKRDKRKGDGTDPQPGEPLEGLKQRSSRPFRKCPDTFRLTGAMVQWANEEYPVLDFEEVRKSTRAFLNHRYKTARIEWVPTWENWIKEEADRKASRMRPMAQFNAAQTPRQQRVAQHFAAAAERPTHRGPPPRPVTTAPQGEIEDVEPRPTTPAIGR
jgi:hypothetical protein